MQVIKTPSRLPGNHFREANTFRLLIFPVIYLCTA